METVKSYLGKIIPGYDRVLSSEDIEKLEKLCGDYLRWKSTNSSILSRSHTSRAGIDYTNDFDNAQEKTGNLSDRLKVMTDEMRKKIGFEDFMIDMIPTYEKDLDNFEIQNIREGFIESRESQLNGMGDNSKCSETIKRSRDIVTARQFKKFIEAICQSNVVNGLSEALENSFLAFYDWEDAMFGDNPLDVWNREDPLIKALQESFKKVGSTLNYISAYNMVCEQRYSQFLDIHSLSDIQSDDLRTAYNNWYKSMISSGSDNEEDLRQSAFCCKTLADKCREIQSEKKKPLCNYVVRKGCRVYLYKLAQDDTTIMPECISPEDFSKICDLYEQWGKDTNSHSAKRLLDDAIQEACSGFGEMSRIRNGRRGL